MRYAGMPSSAAAFAIFLNIKSSFSLQSIYMTAANIIDMDVDFRARLRWCGGTRKER
jgi:hypothetical protein